MDDQAAISIAHHPEFHAQTKHIDIAYHFLCNLVEIRTLNTVYINTHNNVADIFTKALPHATHNDLLLDLGVLTD
jgi:hypothetical protein